MAVSIEGFKWEPRLGICTIDSTRAGEESRHGLDWELASGSGERGAGGAGEREAGVS